MLARAMAWLIEKKAARLVAFASTLLVAVTASATPSAKLTYSRGPGAETCPDESELRKAVAARLGYDPFFPWANKTIEAAITRGKRGFHGEVKVLDADGLVRGARALDATSHDCSDMVRALALAISIALDDLGVEAPAALVEPAPAPPDTTPAASSPSPPSSAPSPDRPPPEAPPPERRVIAVSLWLGPDLSFGTAPDPALGLQIDLRLRYGLGSLDLEARADLPASGGTSAQGQVSTYLVVGSLVPCVHWPAPVFACAVVTTGGFQESGVNLAVPRTASAPYLAAGARVGIEIPLSSHYFLLAHADALGVFLRHAVQIDGMNAFSLPALAGQVGLGAGVTF